MASKVHGLDGGVYGRIVEYDDGTAAFKRPLQLTQEFRVRITDVTGFSVERSKKIMSRRLLVLGNGTTLATVDVAHGVAEHIEGWFRAHPNFVGNLGGSPASPVHTSLQAGGSEGPVLIADELAKLAALRDQGVLTDAEFDAQKAKLLAR